METINFEVTRQAAEVLMQLLGQTQTASGLYPLYVELQTQFAAQTQQPQAE